ncbi:MAG: NFACT family protein [Candidatus Tectomicrobia bacterium]
MLARDDQQSYALYEMMDIFVLKALVDNLQQHLLGAVVSKVFQMSPDDLLLRLWRRQDLRLFLSTHATTPRLHLTTSRFTNPPQPLRFAAYLRAHLQHARLQQITMQPYDRIVFFTWERQNHAPLTLVHELVGMQSNIILIDAHGRVAEALKRIPLDATHSRPILPGQPYQPPPLPPQRLLVAALTREHLEQLEQQGNLDVLHMRRLLIGLSPLLITELLHRSQGNPLACWDLLQDLRYHYEHKSLSLTLTTMLDGTQQVSVLPLTHAAVTTESFASAQEAVAALYQPALQTMVVDTVRRELQKTVRQRLQKLRKKIRNLGSDRQKLQGYLPYQHYGTLLVTQRLPRGATSATVVDYYHPEQPTITIPLDPRWSIHDNAQVYFKKYRKAKGGLTKVDTLLLHCHEEEQYLEGLAQQIVPPSDWLTLQAIETELGGDQSPARRPHRAPARPKPTPAAPYRVFTGRDGSRLYCGKNNQGNEVLLRRMANPEDLWFHAHGHAGAHVLLTVQPGQEVSQDTLIEAASLAAFYSKGKDATAVEVIYTQAKHVRKFRGARPGQVLVTTYHTLEAPPRRPNSQACEGPQTPIASGQGERDVLL